MSASQAKREQPKPGASGILARTNWARNPGFIIHDLQRLIVQVVDQEMHRVGLTNAQLRVVLHLNHREGVSQVALGEEMGIKKASVGVLLERLSEKGLIDRRPDPGDRRANLIYLSDRARDLLDPIYAAGTAVMNGLLAGLDDDETEQLVDLLLRVKGNARQMFSAQEKAQHG